MVGGDPNMAAQPNRQDIRGQEWVKLRKGVFVYCCRCGLSPEEAADVSQQAICIVLAKPEWDQRRHPEMRAWLGSTVNGLIANLRKNVGRKMQKQVGGGTATEPFSDGVGLPAVPSSPEDRAITADRARKGISRILDLVKGKPFAEDVILLSLDEVDTPQEQAQALKVDVCKVYRAREAIAAAAKQALQELED